jgi:FMN reductase
MMRGAIPTGSSRREAESGEHRMLDVVTIAGSPAAPSRCEATLAWTRQELERRGLRTAGVNVRDLDPQALLWGRLGDPGLRAAADLVESARAVVIATPVYKASYAGVLKAFVDVLPPDALAGRTILPIATAGSLAHCLVLDYALKPVVAALGARHVLAGVCLLDGDFAYADGAVASIEDVGRTRLTRALDELHAAISPRPAVAGASEVIG